jgi:lactoylglutathione lyase
MTLDRLSFLGRLFGGRLPRRGFLGYLFGGAILAGGASLGKAGMAAAADSSGITFSRIGMTVSDLDRAVKFYHEALGFEEVGPRQSIGKALATAFQLDASLDVRFVRRDGIMLELYQFDPSLKPAPHPMNQPGLTNLTMVVDDIGKVADSIRKHGGTVLEKTRMQYGAAPAGADIVFCTDPDGLKIALEKVLR